MNKQELIKKLKTIDGGYGSRYYIAMGDVFELVEQLDEPQKPVVLQFVADWYEENKDDFEGELFRCVDLITRDFEDGDLSEFEEWFIDGKTKPFQTLVNMHQFGYEVEKEKRYLVKMESVNEYACYLNKGLLSKEYFWESKAEIGGCRTKHTRKQLEDDNFGWVFDCPGIEIEEVE
nr:MAG TPA: Protein of unknown function (DUF1642) [Caudoviricetes sp.]